MTKELEKELKALAKKHKAHIEFCCGYCQERCFEEGPGPSFIVTFSFDEQSD